MNTDGLLRKIHLQVKHKDSWIIRIFCEQWTCSTDYRPHSYTKETELYADE